MTKFQRVMRMSLFVGGWVGMTKVNIKSSLSNIERENMITKRYMKTC